MLKKVLAISMCFTILSTQAAYAYSPESMEIESKVKSAVDMINSEHDDVKIDLLDSSDFSKYDVINPDDTIELDSIDELQDLVREISITDDSEEVEEVIIDETNLDQQKAKLSKALSNRKASSTTLNGTSTATWNSPTWWQYLTLTWECWIDKNIKADYTYKNTSAGYEFVDAKSASSWISGTTVARSWCQQGDATMNIITKKRTNDTLSVSVTGIYVLGVAVSVDGVDFPIGLTCTQTWERDFRFK